jgi:hypothetical protein
VAEGETRIRLRPQSCTNTQARDDEVCHEGSACAHHLLRRHWSRHAPRAREPSRFVFYIDTDAEKIAFIDWYLTKLQDTDLFEDAGPFDPYMTNFPDGSIALYFECNCNHDTYEKDERVFPVGSDGSKLALSELIIAGELNTIFGGWCSCGLHFKKVKARVAMDTEKATEALENNLPMELAEKIVASAVSED